MAPYADASSSFTATPAATELAHKLIRSESAHRSLRHHARHLSRPVATRASKWARVSTHDDGLLQVRDAWQQSVESASSVSIPALASVLGFLVFLGCCYGLYRYSRKAKTKEDPYTSGIWGDEVVVDPPTRSTLAAANKHDLQPMTSPAANNFPVASASSWRRFNFLRGHKTQESSTSMLHLMGEKHGAVESGYVELPQNVRVKGYEAAMDDQEMEIHTGWRPQIRAAQTQVPDVFALKPLGSSSYSTVDHLASSSSSSSSPGTVIPKVAITFVADDLQEEIERRFADDHESKTHSLVAVAGVSKSSTDPSFVAATTAAPPLTTTTTTSMEKSPTSSTMAIKSASAETPAFVLGSADVEIQEFEIPTFHYSAPATPRTFSLSKFADQPLPSSALGRGFVFPPTPASPSHPLEAFPVVGSLPSPIEGREISEVAEKRITVTVLSPQHPDFPADVRKDADVDENELPRLVKVVGTFQPSMPDELALTVGQTLRLLHVFPDDWCLVQRIHLVDGKAAIDSDDKSASEVEMESGAVPMLCLAELNGKTISSRVSPAVSPVAAEEYEAQELEIPAEKEMDLTSPMSDASSRATHSSMGRSQASSSKSSASSGKASSAGTRTTISRSDSDVSTSTTNTSHWSSATTHIDGVLSPVTPPSAYSLGSIKESPNEDASDRSSARGPSGPSSSNPNGRGLYKNANGRLPSVPPTPDSSQSLEIPAYIQYGHAAAGEDDKTFSILSASVFKKHESSGYANLRETLHKNIQRMEREDSVWPSTQFDESQPPLPSRVQQVSSSSTTSSSSLPSQRKAPRAQTMRPVHKKQGSFTTMFDRTRAS